MFKEFTGIEFNREVLSFENICENCERILIEFRKLRLKFKENQFNFKSMVLNQEQLSINFELKSEFVDVKVEPEEERAIYEEPIHVTTKAKSQKLENVCNYNCDFCEYKTKSSNAMQTHMKNIHTVVAKQKNVSGMRQKSKKNKTFCDHCGKFFYCVKTHLKLSNKLDKYFCDLCAHNTHSKPSLSEHIRRKHMDASFQCDQCEKKFHLYADLKSHKKNKHGARLFFCDQCRKSYGSVVVLRYHKKCAHKQRPELPCDLCDVIFNDVTKLRYHRNEHLNNREYICKLCLEGFYSPRQVERHSCSVKKLEFNCKVEGCGRYFTRLEYFVDHMIKHSEVPASDKKEMVAEAKLKKQHCMHLYKHGKCS